MSNPIVMYAPSTEEFLKGQTDDGSGLTFTEDPDSALQFPTTAKAMEYVLTLTRQAGEENGAWHSGLAPYHLRDVTAPKWKLGEPL